MSPEQQPPQAPQVNYRNGRLTVDAQNSTLNDILTAIRQQTGAQVEWSPGTGAQRMVTHLTGSAHDVVASLLDNANVDYILVANPGAPDQIAKIMVIATGSAPNAGNPSAGNGPPQPVNRREPAPDEDEEEPPAAQPEPPRAQPERPGGEDQTPSRTRPGQMGAGPPTGQMGGGPPPGQNQGMQPPGQGQQPSNDQSQDDTNND